MNINLYNRNNKYFKNRFRALDKIVYQIKLLINFKNYE